MAKVNRAEVVAAFAMLSETWRPYLDQATGRIVHTTWFDLYCAGAGWGPSDDSQWRRDAHDLARRIFKDNDKRERYLPLSEPEGLGWWDAMQAFGRSLRNPVKRRPVLEAMGGPEAFRRCRETIDHLGLAKEWEVFLDHWYERAAGKWCQDNGIEWPDSESTTGHQGPSRAATDAPSGAENPGPDEGSDGREVQ